MAISRKKLKKKLRRAERQLDYVRIIRTLRGADQIDGYVVGRGTKWVTLYYPSEGGPCGYSTIRIADIRTIEWASGGDFMSRSLQIQGAWPPATPVNPLNLDGGRRPLIESVMTCSPVVTLFREKQYPNECYIGEPARWDRRRLWLWSLDTNARWDDEPDPYRLSKISRVDFGGTYERNLAAVAGARPPKN